MKLQNAMVRGKCFVMLWVGPWGCLALPVVVLTVVSCASDEERPFVADAGAAGTVDTADAAAADATLADVTLADALPGKELDAAQKTFDAAPAESWLDTSPPLTEGGQRDAKQFDAREDGAAADGCVPDGGAPQLSIAVVEHACLHGREGPFREVNAGTSPENAPDVSRSHTLFTVLSQAGSTVHVRYLPSEFGDHVLFVEHAELVAGQQGDSSLALERGHVACELLPVSYLMQLGEGEPVELRLRGDGHRIAMVIESLSTWGADAWVRSCDAPVPASDAGACRKSGACLSDSECCSFCHDYDHCH